MNDKEPDQGGTTTTQPNTNEQGEDERDHGDKTTTTTQKDKNKGARKRKGKTKLKERICSRQFVDDNTVMVGAQNYEELKKLLQTTYNKLEEHLIKLEMAINREKTQLTIMGKSLEGNKITIIAGEKQIQHQPSLQVLGFTFCEDGRMDEYLWKGNNNLIRSLRSKTSMLRIIKPYVSINQLTNIGNMILNSAILYAAPLWAQTGTVNLNKIQVAQTKAAKQLLWCGRTKKNQITHRQETLDKAGWMNVQQLTNSATINLIRKAANNESSTGINSMFNYNSNNNIRPNMRNKIKTEPTTRRRTPNILERGTQLFNQLPNELRERMSNHKFKSKLKEHSIDHDRLPNNQNNQKHNNNNNN